MSLCWSHTRNRKYKSRAQGKKAEKYKEIENVQEGPCLSF